MSGLKELDESPIGIKVARALSPIPEDTGLPVVDTNDPEASAAATSAGAGSGRQVRVSDSVTVKEIYTNESIYHSQLRASAEERHGIPGTYTEELAVASAEEKYTPVIRFFLVLVQS